MLGLRSEHCVQGGKGDVRHVFFFRLGEKIFGVLAGLPPLLDGAGLFRSGQNPLGTDRPAGTGVVVRAV